ncbi:MAG: tetratricopeptide repeat protein [Deltaproteobacteria bacterium]|nr:tetratricopeptide repeat protein [Deltaproteobacteria bacterium]
MFLMIIALVTVAVYYGVWSGGFLRDDFPVITENPWITSPSYIPEIFSSSLWGFYKGDFITGESNYYRPVMHLLLMGSYALFKASPAGYHAVNLLFHVLNAFLVFFIASALLNAKEKGAQSRSYLLPFSAALFFSLHPASAEPVVWIAAIGELSFTLFFMAAFYLFVLNGQGSSSLLYALSIAIYIVALFSKETATVLAPLFFFYGLMEGRPLVQALKRGAPYLAAAFVFVFIRSSIVGPLNAEHAMGGFQYLLSVVTLSAQYVEKLVFPFGIKLYYPFHASSSFSDIVTRELGVLVVAAAAVAVWVWKSSMRRTVLFFLLWIAMALAPPILMVKYIQGEWVFASRYLYFSTAGFSMLLAFGLRRVSEKGASVLLLVVALLPFAFESARAKGFWIDEFSFWKKAASDAPMSPTTHASLGVVYAEKKMYAEAIREYEATIKIAPDSAGVYSNLGVVYYKTKETDKAILMFEKAVALSKDASRAGALHARLGAMYLEKGLPEKAVLHLEQAVAAGQGDASLYNFLGVALAGSGQYQRAYAAFSEALKIDPQNAMAKKNLDRLSKGGTGAGE